MNHKRLIATVTVREGLVVKSYGYEFWRPAGRLFTVLRELDLWGVDEILLLDISRNAKLDDRVVQAIRDSTISTPLIYGGGIRNEQDVFTLLEAGCDRFVIETLAFEDEKLVKDLCETFGGQAFIWSVPLSRTRDGGLSLVEASGRIDKRSESDFSSLSRRLKESAVSEVLLIDRDNEGFSGKFSLNTASDLEPILGVGRGIIWFGGVGPHQMIDLFEIPVTSAVAVGNRLLEREVEYSKVRQLIGFAAHQQVLRPANPAIFPGESVVI